MRMSERLGYRLSYDLRQVMLFGAVASSSLIFSVLFLFFLGSQLSSHHPGYSIDTITEMMGYAEFFLFAYGSYFAAAVLVWRYADCFSKISVSWLPITLFGSIVFSISFLMRVWVSDLMTYQEKNPFRSPPPGFSMVVLTIIVVAVISCLITSVGCSLITTIWSKKDIQVIPK